MGLEEGHSKKRTMSAVNALFHIVINTYCRETTLPLQYSDNLYRYIARVVEGKHSVLYAINGIENHIHLLVGLHPSVSLSDFVRDIKLSSTQMIKKNFNLYPRFRGWGKEYGAFSYALRDKNMVERYILNQREHHQRVTFEEEYRKLMENAGIEWNESRLT